MLEIFCVIMSKLFFQKLGI